MLISFQGEATVGSTGHGGNRLRCKAVLHRLQGACARIERDDSCRGSPAPRRYHCPMRDIRFEDMHLFVRVTDLGSLSAVARERDAPVSQVSRTLARIEKACGARLLHRTTHGLTPTPEGLTFLDHWPFQINGEPHVLVAEGHWRSGSTAITARLALQGLGIARLATVVAEPLVRQGLLAPVLADCVDLQPSPIHAITLTRRHRLPKIQACIDHWAQWFSAAEPSD